jgi:hypothetical protein
LDESKALWEVVSFRNRSVLLMSFVGYFFFGGLFFGYLWSAVWVRWAFVTDTSLLAGESNNCRNLCNASEGQRRKYLIFGSLAAGWFGRRNALFPLRFLL